MTPSTANPLIEEKQDTATTYSGAGVVESIDGLCTALKSGSWLDAAVAGVGAAIDMAATVSDPLGSLIAAGLGWLMDHLEPLKGWLNDLTGDAGEVLAFSGTWKNIAGASDESSNELIRLVRADLEGMAGEAVTAYAAYADGVAQ